MDFNLDHNDSQGMRPPGLALFRPCYSGPVNSKLVHTGITRISEQVKDVDGTKLLRVDVDFKPCRHCYAGEAV
jgi:hypothetical protein